MLQQRRVCDFASQGCRQLEREYSRYYKTALKKVLGGRKSIDYTCTASLAYAVAPLLLKIAQSQKCKYHPPSGAIYL